LIQLAKLLDNEASGTTYLLKDEKVGIGGLVE
jgi:hypothetical protein